MAAPTKLIIFTYSYPYGFGEIWKYQEFCVLATYFEQVILQPYTFGKPSDTLQTLPANVTVNAPLLSRPIPKLALLFKGLLNLAPVRFALQDFIKRKVYTHPGKLKSWFTSTLEVRYLAAHPFLQSLRGEKATDTVLYFYWGTGPTLLLPLLQPRNFAKVVVKFHGGDLYEERSLGYLPFRKPIFRSLNHALFISEQGLAYAKAQYGIQNGHVFRLGVTSQGLADFSQDAVLRICTCSSVIPLKRLGLLLDALQHVDFPVHWTHIGDGPLLPDLKHKAKKLPAHVQTAFSGFLPPAIVQRWYAENSVDLFINVSETEGVPVSVMEAYAAGIPVLATAVGGTPEIVSDTSGKLIPPEITSSALAREISIFYNLPLVQKQALRAGARQQFQRTCDGDKLFNALGQFLAQESKMENKV